MVVELKIKKVVHLVAELAADAAMMLRGTFFLKEANIIPHHRCAHHHIYLCTEPRELESTGKKILRT